MAPFDRPVRIANCSGFYGDRLSAAREMIEGGPIDVLSGDWLAELTLLILLRDKLKKPDGGYARTFLAQARQILPAAMARGVKVVSNAGGLNPTACADAVRALAGELGLSPRIAVVDGDDVMPRLQAWADAGRLRHLETGAVLSPADGFPMAAHAYLGAWPIAAALRAGADIVITGRVTDAATVIGPAAWAHGWSPDDLDPLAGALVAGHIIECGGQATGGNFSGWQRVPSLRHVGFPLAEIAADGSSVITKHPGTDGLVDVDTVTAQLLYEIGGADYFSPDVIARLDTVRLSPAGPDRVRVSDTRGLPPTTTLKAGVLLNAGWRNSASFLLGGDDADAKAAAVSDAFWHAVGGRAAFARTAEHLVRADPTQPPALRLSRLMLSAADPDRDKVGRAFGQRAVELALCSVPGLTLDALPEDPSPVGVFWPCLVPAADVAARVLLDGAPVDVPQPRRGAPPAPRPVRHAPAPPTLSGTVRQVKLGELVFARSGDKAGNANVGLWARAPRHVGWLLDSVTAEVVAGWLGFDGEVRRTALPNLGAVNFELVGWLDRGVAANLHPDPQAKCLAECLRSVVIEVDSALVG